MLLQFLCGLSQRGVVIRVLIATHPLPVDGFRHDGGIGMFADNLIITAVRFRELFVHEVNPSQPHRQLGSEFGSREIAFATEPLNSAGIQDQRRWCPQNIKTMEPCGMFFDVGFYRKQILRDVVGRVLIGVRFGIQPNTSSSCRGSTEIQ